MNIIQTIEKEQITEYLKNRQIPEFKVGDTVTVTTQIGEGEKQREQKFTGVCIAYRNKSMGSNFVVRRLAFGSGIEVSFPLYSPNIKVAVERFGKVRQATLYYLRSLTGKAARIKQKKDYKKPESVKN